ncbi:BIG1-domain-containing protein [Pyrenochaeta sp. DS3sAY3a]|nr:BIG1-domain-containing protein [Pyrenochaeta sp. DS3sAY3a]
MAKSLVGALALAALPSALAFRNTSPLFLFSTAELLIDTSDSSLAQSTTVADNVLAALKDCPTQSYVIVEQDGVSSADYADGRSTPALTQYMSGGNADIKTTFAIPEVVGAIDSASVLSYLKTSCGADLDNHGSAVYTLKAPSASKSSRTQELQSNAEDAMLENHISSKAKDHSYTVIYITKPQTEAQAKEQQENEQYTYDMEDPFGESVRMELKRDLSSHIKRANATQGGLFERYQYFTPGIFMGFAAIIPLFLILIVGIRALTSLEVSYFAFSKEMGPNAQRKQ